VVIAFTPILMAFYAVHANLGTYAEDIGFTQAQTALVISVLSFSMMAGKLLCGRLLDVVSHQRLYFLVAGSFITGMLCISLHASLALLLVGAVCMGLALGGTMPLMSTQVLDRFGAAAYGQVMGLLYIFINLSSVGPVAAGWVRDATGSYPTVFLASLAPLALALILMWRFGRTQKPA
jgi:MFS family permease